MSKVNSKSLRLTRAQRQLVEGNMGLVGVHLRRLAPQLAQPRRDREWDDLFQEGCLGLMEAAARWKPESGICFAAFALVRIHHAVSLALRNRFGLIRFPPDRTRRRKGNTQDQTSIAAKPGGPESRPKVLPFIDDSLHRQPDARHCIDEESDQERIGERLRAKHERAVRRVGDSLAKGTSARGDRGELVRLLIEERLLIPQEESRRAMRQIARDTQSSYARVAQCERKLREGVRATLDGDPEYHALKRRAKADPRGFDTVIDKTVESELLTAGAEAMAERYRDASPVEKSRLLESLLATSPEEGEEILKARFVGLRPREREEWLWETRDLRGSPRAGRAGKCGKER